MTILLNALAITAADTGTLRTVKKCVSPAPDHLSVEFDFTYGSGGTSVDAYLVTSFDGGASWIDVANFHVTTSSLKNILNLSANTPLTTLYVPTFGALASNTVKDGIFGGRWAIYTKSAGTYAATSLSVFVFGSRLITP